MNTDEHGHGSARILERRPRLVGFGPFSFDAQNRLLSRDGIEIPLPPRVLAVLELLLSRPGEVISRQEILFANPI